MEENSIFRFSTGGGEKKPFQTRPLTVIRLVYGGGLRLLIFKFRPPFMIVIDFNVTSHHYDHVIENIEIYRLPMDQN